MNHQIWQCVAAATFAAASLPGCGLREKAGPPPLAPEVGVETVGPEAVLETGLPGRVCPYRIAEIRPQVNGIVQKRLFTEGSPVKAGDVLYEVDPAPFQAALDSATANLEAARIGVNRLRAALALSQAGVARQRATRDLAQISRRRMEALLTVNAASGLDREDAITNAEAAQACLQVAEAQVESDRQAIAAAEAAVKQADAAVATARINLGYTRITAPISGRIGRSTVTDGALVTAYQPVALATVQQLDPIYVDVPRSTDQLLRLRRRLEDGRLPQDGGRQEMVKLTLVDGTTYPLDGTLQFQDATVDPTTGSVILRAVFPNPKGVLLPGMLVRASVKAVSADAGPAQAPSLAGTTKSQLRSR